MPSAGRGPRKGLGLLELELQMFVSCHAGAGEPNLPLMEESPEPLITEPHFQPGEKKRIILKGADHNDL